MKDKQIVIKPACNLKREDRHPTDDTLKRPVAVTMRVDRSARVSSK